MDQNPDASLATFIDHTLLRADAREEEIRCLCHEARQYGFATVCVNPCHVALAAGELEKSPVQVCTVIDFPLGAGTPELKAFSAAHVKVKGAREIDMVLDIAALKSKNHTRVEEGIRAVVRAAGEGVLIKVILETCYLTEEEIRKACGLAEAAGAHFVKTSTGFGPAGATPEAVRIMRAAVGDRLGIKAAGGIHDAATARAMLDLGATRIGASAGLKIIGVST